MSCGDRREAAREPLRHDQFATNMPKIINNVPLAPPFRA